MTKPSEARSTTPEATEMAKDLAQRYGWNAQWALSYEETKGILGEGGEQAKPLIVDVLYKCYDGVVHITHVKLPPGTTGVDVNWLLLEAKIANPNSIHESRLRKNGKETRRQAMFTNGDILTIVAPAPKEIQPIKPQIAAAPASPQPPKISSPNQSSDHHVIMNVTLKDGDLTLFMPITRVLMREHGVIPPLWKGDILQIAGYDRRETVTLSRIINRSIPNETVCEAVQDGDILEIIRPPTVVNDTPDPVSDVSGQSPRKDALSPNIQLGRRVSVWQKISVKLFG